MSSIALILAGHGSHVSPNTAGVVWQMVDRLRRRGIADEITACFWKEQPHFHQVLHSVTSETVVIVPVFTAKGFYTQQVIPVEMGLSGEVTQRGKRTIYYTPTLGEHPDIDDVVKSIVRDSLHEANLSKKDTAVAILGHGTKRSSSTRETTQRQTENIRELDIVAEVVDAYLDDDPNIPSIYTRTSAPNIIAVPFFLAQGSHTTIDVPGALGIEYGTYPADVNGRNVYYTPPLGTHPRLDDIVLDLARQVSSLPFEEQTSPLFHNGEGEENSMFGGGEVSGFPRAGADALLETLSTLRARETITLGDLILARHLVMPQNSTQDIALRSPAELREHLRENPTRTLTTGDDLPRDWVVPVSDIRQIPAVIETVYPSLLGDWHAKQSGRLHIHKIDDLVAREHGLYKDLDTNNDTTIKSTRNSLCAHCVRTPTWSGEKGNIPCAVPCSHFLSFTKEGTSS